MNYKNEHLVRNDEARMDLLKGPVLNSVQVPEFHVKIAKFENLHLKKVGGYVESKVMANNNQDENSRPNNTYVRKGGG